MISDVGWDQMTISCIAGCLLRVFMQVIREILKWKCGQGRFVGLPPSLCQEMGKPTHVVTN
jgi:hypothetical protein